MFANPENHISRGALPEPFPIEGTTRSIQLYYFPNPHKFLQKLLDVNAIVACAMLFADKIKNLETEERPPSSALGAIGTGERISPSDPRCGSVNLFFGRAFGQEITLAQAQWSLRAIAQASLEKNSHGNYKFNEEARIVSCIVLRRQSLQLVPIEMDEVDPLDNDVPATNGQANRTDLVL